MAADREFKTQKDGTRAGGVQNHHGTKSTKVQNLCLLVSFVSLWFIDFGERGKRYVSAAIGLPYGRIGTGRPAKSLNDCVQSMPRWR